MKYTHILKTVVALNILVAPLTYGLLVNGKDEPSATSTSRSVVSTHVPENNNERDPRGPCKIYCSGEIGTCATAMYTQKTTISPVVFRGLGSSGSLHAAPLIQEYFDEGFTLKPEFTAIAGKQIGVEYMYNNQTVVLPGTVERMYTDKANGIGAVVMSDRYKMLNDAPYRGVEGEYLFAFKGEQGAVFPMMASLDSLLGRSNLAFNIVGEDEGLQMTMTTSNDNNSLVKRVLTARLFPLAEVQKHVNENMDDNVPAYPRQLNAEQFRQLKPTLPINAC